MEWIGLLLGQAFGEILGRFLPKKALDFIERPAVIVPFMILVCSALITGVAFAISFFWNPATVVDWISLICISVFGIIVLISVVMFTVTGLKEFKEKKYPKSALEEG